MDARVGFPSSSSPGLLQLSAVLCLALSGSSTGAGFNASYAVNPPRTPTRSNALRQTHNASAAMFTFNRPGRSFVEYRHVWPSLSSAVRLNVRLRFRTVRSSSILAVLSSASERPARVSSNSTVLLPTTLIRLHRGGVHVSVSDQDSVTAPAQSSVVIGRGLFLLHIHSYKETEQPFTKLTKNLPC